MTPRSFSVKGFVGKNKQRGFIRVGGLRKTIFWGGGKKFTPSQLFKAGEAGAHYEVYNPYNLLKRRNRLTWSSKFTNSVWTRTNIASVTAKADGLGDLVIADAVTGQHSINQASVLPVSGVFVSAFIRAKPFGSFSFIHINSLTGTSTFDVSNGTVINLGGNTCSITPAGNGYYDCFLAGGSSSLNLTMTISSNSGSLNSTGDGVTTGMYFAQAQVEWHTLVPSDYQEVTDWNTEYLAIATRPSIFMWQDFKGTTPVTAVEQPVGLWMDTKKAITVGPNLLTGDSSTFDGGTFGNWVAYTGATGSISDGKVVLTAIGTYQYVNLVTVDKWYYVQFDWTRTTTDVAFGLGDRNGANSQITVAAGTILSGTASGYIKCAFNSAAFNYTAGTGTLTLDNIQISEISGNHAFQITSGARPTLSARFNLLIKTEQFEDVTWLKAAMSVPVSSNTVDTLAPNSTQTADKLTFDAGGRCGQSLSVLANSSVRCSIYVKKSNRQYFVLGCSATGTTSSNAVLARFDLNTGTYVDTTINGVGYAVIGEPTITSVGDGWYRLQLDAQLTGGATAAATYLAASASSGGQTSDAGAEVYVWGADTRTTSDISITQPVYQRVNVSTDYETDGFIHYFKFDGTDDSFSTVAIDCSSAAFMTCWANVTKLSDAAVGIITEFGASAATTDGGFYMAAPDAAAAPNYAGATRGTVDRTATNYVTFTAPNTSVVTGMYDNSAATRLTQIKFRVNGVQVSDANTTIVGLGTTSPGNYGNLPLNIGRRNNASLPFNGRMVSLTIRGTTSPTSSKVIKSHEQYVAKLAGLTFTST